MKTINKMTDAEREHLRRELDWLTAVFDEAMRRGDQEAAHAALEQQFTLLHTAAHGSGPVH